MSDVLREAIVAELARQVNEHGDYFAPDCRAQGWQNDLATYDGRLDIDALCAAIRAALGIAAPFEPQTPTTSETGNV